MKTLVLHTALAVLYLIWLFAPAIAVEIDSEQEARAAGIAFLEAMNWPYGQPSKARVDEVPGHGTQWRVEFSGAALVNIDPTTGQIITATDLSQQALLDSTPEPVEDKVDEEKARAIAEGVLDAVGRLTDVRFLGSEKSRDKKEWRFAWVRTFNDIAYRDDIMAIRLSTVNGKLLGFGRSFVSATPPTAVVKLTEADAITAARKTMLSLGISETDIRTAGAELKVVQPNNYWGPGPATEGWGSGGPSRVAWIVTIGQDHGLKEFWIDADDGSLLGGTQTKSNDFTRARMGENVPGAGSQIPRNSFILWLITGVTLPLALLLLFLLRRSIRGKVRLSD